MLRARTSKASRATSEKSTAVTCCPRAARNAAFLPVPQATSSAGPDGRSGKSSRTMLAGSEAGVSAASLCWASQSAWLEGIKKRLLNLRLRSLKESVKAYRVLPCSELDAEGAAAAAGALHIGIVKLESGAFNRLDIIDLDPVQIHGAHLVDSDLQPVKLKNLVRIGGLV